MGKRKLDVGLLLCLSCLLLAVAHLQSVAGIPDAAANPSPKAASIDNSDWHEGTDNSTGNVKVTYRAFFSDPTDDDGDGLVNDQNYREKMEITFNDGTGSVVAFDILCGFKDGKGVDVAAGKVTDWSECDGIEPTLAVDGTIPAEYGLGGHTHSETVFLGFDIYNGTSGQLGIVNTTTSDGGWNLELEWGKQIARVMFGNQSVKIGAVTINEETVGGVLTDTVTFDVNINATIGTGANLVDIPATLSFTVTHTANYTRFKYGADVDWSAAKAFPTEGNINSGDPYCVVPNMRTQICTYAPEFESISTYETNAGNDTIIFKKSGHTLGTIGLTKEFNIKGETTTRETNRTYYANAGYDPRIYGDKSAMFVVFDGFVYNQSTGLEFDPVVTIYCGTGADIPGVNVDLIGLVACLGVGAVVLRLRRKR
ncbi:MAG: hypothetical protein ACTSU5_12320 [Promethearchaeota archaeon]